MCKRPLYENWEINRFLTVEEDIKIYEIIFPLLIASCHYIYLNHVLSR